MFKKLHILVVKSFIPPFIATFVVAIFVLILQFLWLYVDELIGKGLEAWVIIKLLFYASVQVIPLAMPIAVMLASIMTFGNMGENYELTAIKAAGISLFRVFMPMIIISAFLGLVNFWVADKIVPEANLRLQTMLFDIRQRHPALNFQPGLFNYDVEGYVIRIGRKSPNSDMMYDFLVYDHTNAEANNRVIVADSGLIQITKDFSYLVLSLYNGCQYDDIPEKQFNFEQRHFPHRADYFKTYRVIIKLEGFNLKQTNDRLFRSNYQMLSSKQLKHKIDSLKKNYERRKQYYVNMLLNNYLFVRGIKMLTRRDSMRYYQDLLIWRTLKPKQLKIVLNTDNLYRKMSFSEKQEVWHIASSYVNRIISQLNVAAIDLKTKKIWIAKHQIAYYKKFTLAIACFIFFFIGAPLGAIIRKGGFGFPTIISILIFLFYYIISISSENLILQGVLSADIGMWISTILFIPITGYLVYRVSTDRVVTNLDYYIEKFKEILQNIAKFVRRKKHKRKK